MFSCIPKPAEPIQYGNEATHSYVTYQFFILIKAVAASSQHSDCSYNKPDSANNYYENKYNQKSVNIITLLLIHLV